MPKIWLPLSYGGRTRNILIPNIQEIDEGQLEEIVAWQKEKTLQELKDLPSKKPISVARAKEIGEQLNEYLQFLRRKQKDSTKRFY